MAPAKFRFIRWYCGSNSLTTGVLTNSDLVSLALLVSRYLPRRRD